ncbi:MAG: UDP-N-acetylmuramoyl-tripeptide--D-alanyl-D-alanine ligase [Clostridia bacterium]|nr:UDP-N-acetylmuramoyl-tripeptide--D-alanyl-D-alanine ligase [Clostridia bacterium]
MIYFLMCICVFVLSFASYLFIKTYQLCGYNISQFLDKCISLKLAAGDKNKLVFTKRMVRFYILYVLLLAALFFLPFYYVGNGFLIALDVLLVFLLTPIWICLTHYIILPLENLIKQIYIKKAKKKLAKKNIIKIAITGSFGKTSVKNILTHILEKEYKVCATPKNYNTEMGTTLTILNELDDHDIFISEMGARHKKDIEKLTKIVEPDFAVMTAIGKCHIETFKSIENIEDTKFELPQNLSPKGEAFFNGNNLSTLKLYKKFRGNKFLTCKEGGFAYAKNIEVGESGSKFDLVLDGNEIQVKTSLLGNFNIDNIVLSAALAYRLGVSTKDIESAIKSLKPTPHRLELIKTPYSTVLDDAYNSNEIGFAEALNVLSMFSGRKIVVTPGMVELGVEQSEINFKLGGKIADVCDYLIIMNNVNKNELLSGAISHNFKKENIFFANTREEQKELIKLLSCKDCVILFENDLPDNYN